MDDKDQAVKAPLSPPSSSNSVITKSKAAYFFKNGEEIEEITIGSSSIMTCDIQRMMIDDVDLPRTLKILNVELCNYVSTLEGGYSYPAMEEYFKHVGSEYRENKDRKSNLPHLREINFFSAGPITRASYPAVVRFFQDQFGKNIIRIRHYVPLPNSSSPHKLTIELKTLEPKINLEALLKDPHF